MFGTLPFFVALISRAFGLERLRSATGTATVISFSGVALVAAGASSGLSGTSAESSSAWPPRQRGRSTRPPWAPSCGAIRPIGSAHSGLLGSVPLILTAIVQIGEQDWDALSGLAWACFVYSLFFSLVFTNIMWFTAIDQVGAGALALRQPAALPPRLLRTPRPPEAMSTLQVGRRFVIGARILLPSSKRPPAPSQDYAPSGCG